MKKSIYIIIGVFVSIFFTQNVFSQNWLDSADIRIENIRKGDFQLKIVDGDGLPIQDTIEVNLVKHEFKWGTVVPIPDGSEEYYWAQGVMKKYFNQGVFGNEFKWPWMERVQGEVTYETVDSVVSWGESVGIDIRGHALIWGGTDNWEMPQWTLDGSLTPEEIYAACETRIKRDVAYYKGRIKEYDVYNEAVEGHETNLAETVGDSILWNSFKWAREADPDAKLYINDYNILASYSVNQYITLITKLLENGAPIDGIGMQGHLSSINWVEIKTNLDKMSQFGIPLKITEFDLGADDNNILDEKLAEGYANMMRIAFSYPLMEGLVFWAFHDNDAWRPGSGIFGENRMPKPAADSVYHLIHEKWTTNNTLVTNEQGEATFRGFYGDYNIQINIDGETRVLQLNAMKQNEDSVFTLNMAQSLPEPIRLDDVTLSPDGSEVELKFNQNLVRETVNKSNFRIFKEKGLPISNIAFSDVDSSLVILSLGQPITYRQKYSVTCDYANIQSVKGSVLHYFDPVFIENKIPGLTGARTSDETILLDFSDVLTGNLDVADFELTMNEEIIPIISAEFDASDASGIVLTINREMVIGEFVFITYTGNSLTSEHGYVLKPFADKLVVNENFYNE